MYNTYGDSGYKLIFADGEQYCRQWYNVYSQNQYQSEVLGSWIAVTNILLQVIFRYVSKFRRETDQAEVDKATTFNIFIAMFFNTAGLVTLAHSNFFAGKERIEKNSKFDIFIGTYSEYNSEWYLNIGSVI